MHKGRAKGRKKHRFRTVSGHFHSKHAAFHNNRPVSAIVEITFLCTVLPCSSQPVLRLPSPYREKYLFKNRTTEVPPNSYYHSLYPKIIQDIEVSRGGGKNGSPLVSHLFFFSYFFFFSIVLNCLCFRIKCIQEEVHYITSSMSPSLKPSQYNNDATEIQVRKTD